MLVQRKECWGGKPVSELDCQLLKGKPRVLNNETASSIRPLFQSLFALAYSQFFRFQMLSWFNIEHRCYKTLATAWEMALLQNPGISENTCCSRNKFQPSNCLPTELTQLKPAKFWNILISVVYLQLNDLDVKHSKKLCFSIPFI